MSSDDESSASDSAPAPARPGTGLSSDDEDDAPASKPTEDAEMTDAEEAKASGSEDAKPSGSGDAEMKDKEEQPSGSSGRRVVQDSDSDEDEPPAKEAEESKTGHTGLTDSEDEEPSPKKKRTGLSSDEEDESPSKPANEPGRAGLSSDDEDESPSKRADGGSGESSKHTAKDIFGEDSDGDEPDSNKVKAAPVKLNKETGQLELGEAEEVDPSRITEGMMQQAAARAEERHAASHKVVPVKMPQLERPNSEAKLSLIKLSKHLALQPVVWEDKKVKNETEDTVARWRYKAESGGSMSEKRESESNTRIVKWSDGSYTLHVGDEVLQLKEESLETNLHHLYAKQAAELDQDDEETPAWAMVEAHGVLDTKLICRPFSKSKLSKSVLTKVSKEIGAHTVDKSDLFIKKTMDESEERQALTQKESMRIRNQMRSEASSRRRGGGEMTEDFLERDMEGDVGGLVRSMKNRRKMPDDSAVRRAKAGAGKKRGRESSEEESSSSSEDEAPAPRSSNPPNPEF